jgi:hypothetical protein
VMLALFVPIIWDYRRGTGEFLRYQPNMYYIKSTWCLRCSYNCITAILWISIMLKPYYSTAFCVMLGGQTILLVVLPSSEKT